MLSNEDVPKLTVPLLETLEARWRQVGAPIAHHLRPGLPGEQIADIAAPLGLPVPVEARVWWGWHDGASGTIRVEHEPFPGWGFPSLTEAVEQAMWERNEAVGLAGQRAETLLWRSSWLPIATDIGGNHAVVDCAQPPELPSPVYYVDREEDATKFEPRVPSVGVLIEWWIDAISHGAAEYDTVAGRWRQHFERLDPTRARTGLL